MPDSLRAILDCQSQSLARFVELLRREQAALSKGDAAELPAINQNKTELIETLNRSDADRYRILTQAGYSGDATGMNAWLSSQADDMNRLWQKILQLAREAKELNRLNGQLIAARLQATDAALSALNVKAKEGSLYGPQGQKGSFTGSRIIDSA